MSQLHVTQIHSAAGALPKHRGTMRALGLRGIGQDNVLPDRPEIRGMLARVEHLVSTVEVAETPSEPARRRTAKSQKAAE